MNKKEMLRKIKQDFESHIPEKAPKTDWSLLEEKPVILKQTKKPFLQSFLVVKMALTTVFVLALVVVGLNFFNQEQAHMSTNPYVDSNYKNTFSISAMSTATLLSNNISTPVSYNKALSSITPLTTSKTVDLIEPYLEMVEILSGQDRGIIITNELSDKELYEFKVTLATVDIMGQKITHILYFNETHFEKDGDEEEFIIEGIFVINNEEFDFIGKKEIDNDEKTISFKTIYDAYNYVESIYSIEENESYYMIKTVQNGVVTSKIEVEIEEEFNEKSIKLRYIDGDDYGFFEFDYEIIDGLNMLNVEFETFISGVRSAGEMVIEVRVDSITGETIYHIIIRPDDDDEYEYEIDRDIDDEEDEDEEYEEDEDEEDEDNENYNEEDGNYDSDDCSNTDDECYNENDSNEEAYYSEEYSYQEISGLKSVIV